MKEPKILFASSQFVLYNGIIAILKTDFENIKGNICSNFNDFLLQLNTNKPHLVFVDCMLTEWFLEENLPQIESAFTHNKVILIGSNNNQAIYDLHKLPINGFITSFATETEIKEAFAVVLQGGKYFSQKVVQALIELSMQRGSQKQLNPHETLTEREMEIFMLVTQGKATKEIADILFLSTHTVYTHRKNILKKLACKSAADLINYAHSKGLVETD